LPKKKTEKPQREVTKRQLSHWQRESRMQRFTMIGGIIVIVAILAVIGTGLFMNKFRPLHEVVIKVETTQKAGASATPKVVSSQYDMDYFINILVYYGKGYSSSGLNQIQGYTYSQYLSNIADSVAQQIGKNALFIQEAANLGFTVGDDEVIKAIKDRGLTQDQTRIDAVRAELVIKKLTDEYFDKQQVPASGEQKAVLAMFLESPEKAQEVVGTLNDTSQSKTFQDLAAELSTESVSKGKSGDFGWVPQGVLPTILKNPGDKVLEDKVFDPNTAINVLTQAPDPDLSKSIGYWLLKVTENKTDTKEVHLLAMLLPSEQAAKDIKTKLDAGEDFITLAKTNSQYTNASEDGGDLGLISKGKMGDAVDKVIFPDDATKALELNKVSDPLADTSRTTTGGVWLVKVTGSENQNITGDNRTILVNQKVTEWADKVWNDNQDKVQILLTDVQKAYAVEQAQTR
jgi:parvulin-like peptidyl-prolyl isomerase